MNPTLEGMILIPKDKYKYAVTLQETSCTRDIVGVIVNLIKTEQSFEEGIKFAREKVSKWPIIHEFITGNDDRIEGIFVIDRGEC